MAPKRKQQQQKAHSPEENIITPERSPIKKSIMITQRQKQALIDNLQLEITERARRLRAQYVLQAQSLRSKLERRVSRVPLALRNKTMGDLLLEYAAMKEVDDQEQRVKMIKRTAPRKDQANQGKHIKPSTAPKSRGTKRKSDEMHDHDKENTPDPTAIPLPKRQARDIVGAHAHPSTVLSPKSSNSRTMPQSPIRQHLGTPAKPVPRPISPLKPTVSPFKSAAVAATAGLANMVVSKSTKASSILSRANSKTIKAPPRPTKAPQPRTVSAASNVSGSSGTSTGTIVRRVGAAIKSSVVPRKTAASTRKTAASRKTVITKVKTDLTKPEVTVGGRTLRKRF